MRYRAPEKLEIIRLVEQSHLPVRRTLGHLGIPRPTFYRWYELYRAGGAEALHDRPSKPDRVWNRIGDQWKNPVFQGQISAEINTVSAALTVKLDI